MHYDDLQSGSLRAKVAELDARVRTLERESATHRAQDAQTSERLRQTEILLTKLEGLVKAIEDMLRSVRGDVEGLKLSRAHVVGLIAGSGAVGGLSGAVAQIAAALLGG